MFSLGGFDEGPIDETASTTIGENSAMPKIDIAAVPERKGTGYPPQFNAPCAERVRQRLGNAAGLTDFGINLMRCRRATGRASGIGTATKTSSSMFSKAS